MRSRSGQALEKRGILGLDRCGDVPARRTAGRLLRRLSQMTSYESPAKRLADAFIARVAFAEVLAQLPACEAQFCEASRMDLMPGQAAAAVERHDCPTCGAPAGSACRTRGGKTAIKYHTPRFILVPALREDLEVSVPADRGPGRVWKVGLPPTEAAPAQEGTRPIRIGYARCSTAAQELESQLVALKAAHCKRIFSEKISTRIKVRPELEKALDLAHEIKRAAPDQPVILTVHEL